jgi:hypothetical protein
MRERFPRRHDSNLRCPNDNRNDKGQRDYSGPPESAGQMISSRPWIVPREARSRRRSRTSRSSSRRSARGTQAPIPRLSTVITSGGHSAPPVVARRSRSRRTRNPRTTIKRTKGAMRSSRMPRRPSTSSSGVMVTSAPDGTRSYFSGRSCPSSQRYHDHFVGRRSPSRSPAMISGQASRSLISSPWSWIQLWLKSGSPRCSSTVGAVSTSSSPALYGRWVWTSRACWFRASPPSIESSQVTQRTRLAR